MGFVNRSVLVGLALLALATEVQAKGGGSANPEIFFQPGGGELALTADYYSLGETELTIANAATDATIAVAKYTTTSTEATVEYGLSSNISLGLNVGTEDAKVTISGVDAKSTGMKDIAAILKTSWGSGTRMHFGLTAAMSSEKKKSAYGGNDGNSYSGGSSFEPYLGVSLPIGGSSWVGLRGAFTLKQDRKVETSATNEDTKTEGNIATMAAFWELTFGPVLLNLTAGVKSTDKEKSTDSAGAVTEDAAYSSTLAGVELKYFFSPQSNLALGYSMTMDPERKTSNETQKYKAFSLNAMTASLRFVF